MGYARSLIKNAKVSKISLKNKKSNVKGLKRIIVKATDFINPLLSKKSVEQDRFEKFQRDLKLWVQGLKFFSKRAERHICQ